MESKYMEIIRTSTDIRKNYPEMAKLCKENQMPIVVTVNGRADTVLMSYTQFLEMRSELELYEHMAQSEDDIRRGRVNKAQDVFDKLDKDLKEAEHGL